MPEQSIFSVSQINEYIKMTLESSPVLKNVFLRGEVSNFKSNYSSGHLYFSLKDETSSIKAVMFRSNASRLKFRLESGMKVVVHGRISTYTVSGDCQIIIDDMQPDGAGALAIAFEQLKKRLMAEGLFDAERKKPIPKFPKKVGVITSASGAALHDIINVSGRRSPATEIIIYPSYVQGELAPKSLTGGILFFNRKCQVDVIIIGRGGGSAEDLWCFNDEVLARAIAESEVPVISAVGHETDFTICDFVADLRAPTPSAAAELAFPDTAEILSRVKVLGRKAEDSTVNRLNNLQNRLEIMRKSVELHSPSTYLASRENTLALLKGRLNNAQKTIFDDAQNRFRMLCTRLEGVNPLAVLSHGYSVVENREGSIVSSVADVETGELITIKLSDGEINATVTEKKIN
ncbi:MAG: exodeoxyribonuclease VII large subunit [Clostridia bacterium]|nr:exodeoxyribonuclease VII large subunit [Clostridia bacterium]